MLVRIEMEDGSDSYDYSDYSEDSDGSDSYAYSYCSEDSDGG